MSLLSPPAAPLRDFFPLVGRGALPLSLSMVAIEGVCMVDEGARMLRVEDRMLRREDCEDGR